MPRSILIVDDVETNRIILKKILGSEYTILEAENGEEALRVMHHQYKGLSAIVLDLMMPVMNGYEVLQKMRDNVVLKQIPVIMVTSSSDEEAKVRALALGANDFVTKPYNPEILRHCLHNNIHLRETASIINAMQRDKLTGLYSREAFFEKVLVIIRNNDPGTFILSCFDIDNFKLINDQYGAVEGDRILKHIAQTLKEAGEKTGGICSRISADNFAILYPNTDAVIQTISKFTELNFASSSVHVNMSYSIGRYVVTDLTLPVSAMYDRAYIAKQSIKGLYDKHMAYFDESMLDALIQEQRIIGDMDDALTGRQFEVWFQPQINHATGALIGAEALVRWRHPQRGLISPGIFIPIFEQNGFIYALDKYVWEETCRLLRKWMDEGRHPLPISVNISRYDVFREDLLDVINDLIDRYMIPADMLRLEITESAFAQSSDQIIRVVKQLMNSGFTVEIDDFGSGYSSLNTLKDVPADVLKLDMRFLEEEGDTQRGGNIVESVVRMAKWLGMSVLAEGVETIEQANFLKSIGCSYVQGYLYAKPMPAAEYEIFAVSIAKESKLLAMETVENMDNNAFWNPASMDTLIFNSFVGGACILEYCNQKIELLRASDKFAKMLGGDTVTADALIRLNLSEALSAENYATLERAIRKAIDTREEVAGEYRIPDLPGCTAETYIHATLRVIAAAGERYMIYCNSEDITEKKLAEKELQKTDEQIRFLNDMAHDLLAQQDGNAGVCATLGKLLRYFGGERAYVFEFDYDNAVAYNSYEVCGDSVKMSKTAQSAIPLANMTYWLHAFDDCPYVYISDATVLEAKRIEKQQMLKRGISSYVAVPLRRNGVLIGVMGIDNLQQHQSGLEKLLAIGDYIAVMLTRRDLNVKILNDNRDLLALMNDTPGGFMRLQLLPDGRVKPLYCNDGFCKLLGMEREQLMQMYADDVLSGVHPDDAATVQEIIRDLQDGKDALSARYRQKNGNGSYIPLMLFGRSRKDATGNIFFNVYYTDITQQIAQEEERSALLDNIPCGACLFEFDGRRMTAVHLNKRYMELVGRNFSDLSKVSVADSIHPDDRPVLWQELQQAIGEHRDIVEVDLRIRYGTDGYRNFHVTGRMLPAESGRIFVYAAYTLIPDEKAIYQQMLPVALNALMDFSSDMMFVKDRNHRYICCSRSFAALAGLKNPRDAIGKTNQDLIGDKKAQHFFVGEETIFSTGKPLLDYDEKLIGKDGTAHYAKTSKYPLMDTAGNVIGIYGIARDMTTYHTVSNRLQLLTDTLPGGIGSLRITPRKVTWLYFNEGMYAFSGYSREIYAEKILEDPLFLVIAEDRPMLRKCIRAVRAGETEIGECVYRSRASDGGCRWFSLKGAVAEREKNAYIVNIVQFDITEQKQNEENLRMSREQFRIAAALGDRTVTRYDIRSDIFYHDSELLLGQGFDKEIHDALHTFVSRGCVDESSVADFVALYDRVRAGVKETTATVCLRVPDGKFRWFRLDATTVFDVQKHPSEAIMVFSDVTEQREKEAVYAKWQQSLREKSKESYTLFQCNLSKNASFDLVEGTLLQINFAEENNTFRGRTQEYVTQCVYPDDRKKYRAFLDVDKLVSDYRIGQRSKSMDFREQVPGGSYRWLRITVELVEYPGQKDIKAFLLYENIDTAKKTELATIVRAETDALTGVLNRVSFANKMEDSIAAAPDARFALLMLDLDGFKQVNDVFGHAVGDQALMETANSIRTILRREDLFGRLGGDEFLVFLQNVPNDAVAASKAARICELTCRSFSAEVQISASVGIAMAPRDGKNFSELYKKADAALYHVKGSGKNNYVFYRKDIQDESLNPEIAEKAALSKLKPRMLIVDDNQVDYQILANMFRDEFVIDRANNGSAALTRLRHYGSAISVVLLDLVMPGLDGFAVLKQMRKSREMQSIPVIVVSGDSDRDTSLQAIRCGAADFVTKPVDAELLHIRVRSAVSKAENERLRVQNTCLQMQSEEIRRYRTVLEHTGLAIMGYDWGKGSFVYDAAVSAHIAGIFDERTLWLILLSDMVADTGTVRRMQEFLQQVAEDRTCMEKHMPVCLRIPSGSKHWFRMTVYKLSNEFQLTEHLIMTFADLGAQLPPEEQTDMAAAAPEKEVRP